MNENILELSKEFSRLQTEHEALSLKLKEIETAWQDIEAQLLNSMVEEGVNSLDIEGIGKLSLRTRNYLSVNAANKDRFFEYLKESGNGHLLKLDVNPRTLTSFLSEHLETVMKELQGQGLDVVDSREKALTFLNEKGASYFTKRDIILKGK